MWPSSTCRQSPVSVSHIRADLSDEAVSTREPCGGERGGCGVERGGKGRFGFNSRDQPAKI